MQLDIIICTYNRHLRAFELVLAILKIKAPEVKIIVVDSTDSINEQLVQLPFVKYIHSSHKSQPYQRYVGWLASTAEIVVFLDDDVEIIRNDIFAHIINAFNQREIVGVSTGINYQTSIRLNKSTQKGLESTKTGEISWFGNSMGLPSENVYVDYFPGPIMSFRRIQLIKVFDSYLFYLFENRVAMGEDKVISMRASIEGKLLYLGKYNYLYHPALESSYFENDELFIAKNYFSRYWINKIYCKVHRKSLYLGNFLYVTLIFKHLFLAIMALDSVKFKGVIKGLQYLRKYSYARYLRDVKIDYFNDAKLDLQKS